MSKVLLAEVLVLAALLIVALILSVKLLDSGSQPAISNDPAIETTQTTQVTTEETTEPKPTWMTLPANRKILAKQYFVYDVSADKFITISGNQNDKIYPASVTKLFTCYVALQFLQPETQIKVGNELDLVRAGSSVAELRKGDVLTVSQLVEAMLLPSGNDAAYVLAYNAGKQLANTTDVSECVNAFMTEMNNQAKRVGMTGANFANPDGIHRDNHYMTFRDLAILGKLSVSDDTIMKNAVIASEVVKFIQRGAAVDNSDQHYYSKTEELDQDTVKWKNTNELIDPASAYYCPYATGLKTGQTPSAGSCLLSSFTYEGKTYIIGVFGCPETPDRFEDTLQLFNETIS